MLLICGATSTAAIAAVPRCKACPAGTTPVADGNCVNLSNSVETACPSGTPTTPATPTTPQTTLQQKIQAAKTQSIGFIPNQSSTYTPHIQDAWDQNAGDWRWYFGIPTGEGPATTASPGVGAQGPSNHLGMYISPSGGSNDGYLAGGGAVLHSSGYGLTDSAGVLAPGTKGPSLTDVSGGGSIGGYYDASWLLPASQGLLFRGFFNYSGDELTLGSIAGLAAASAGSARFNTYTFGGSATYNIGATYAEASGAGDFGSGSETNGVDGSTGSFNTQGYFADLRIGTIFPLLATGGVPPVVTKAAPKVNGGTVLALDVSGHVGYTSQQINGFTDSTGFVFGDDRTQFGDVGARVKLFMVIPDHGVYWMPYVAGTVDQLFGYSSTLNIPVQAALPTGDVVGLSQAQTFGGGELGLDARVPNGWTIGAKGFYTASADTNIAGGTAYVRIPLNYTPLPASRY